MFEIITINLHQCYYCFLFNFIAYFKSLKFVFRKFLFDLETICYCLILSNCSSLAKNLYFVFYKVPNTCLTFEK